MIDETPFTKEEFESFMIGMRERAQERRRNRHFAITSITFTAIICGFCIAMAVFGN